LENRNEGSSSREKKKPDKMRTREGGGGKSEAMRRRNNEKTVVQIDGEDHVLQKFGRGQIRMKEGKGMK